VKALILAGGRGKRMDEHSAESNKCMLAYGGKPLIQHSLDHCVRIAPEEVVIVVGYLAEQIVKRLKLSRNCGKRNICDVVRKCDFNVNTHTLCRLTT